MVKESTGAICFTLAPIQFSLPLLENRDLIRSPQLVPLVWKNCRIAGHYIRGKFLLGNGNIELFYI